MQNTENLLENDNFLNNQNYVNSKLQKKLPFFSTILSNKLISIINKWYCIYDYKQNNKEILFIILFIIFAASLWKIISWNYVWLSISLLVIHILLNILLALIEIIGTIFIIVYVLLRVSWYNIMKMKVFINFIEWKKYTICKVGKFN